MDGSPRASRISEPRGTWLTFLNDFWYSKGRLGLDSCSRPRIRCLAVCANLTGEIHRYIAGHSVVFPRKHAVLHRCLKRTANLGPLSPRGLMLGFNNGALPQVMFCWAAHTLLQQKHSLRNIQTYKLSLAHTGDDGSHAMARL